MKTVTNGKQRKLRKDLELDPKAVEPVYKQLVSLIRNEILSGSLMPGDRLPSTTQLRQRFGVTIDTVQKSLSILAVAGLVERVPRRGTFVCDRSGRKSICLLLGRNIFVDDNAAFQASLFDHFQSQALAEGLHVDVKMMLPGDDFGLKLRRVERDIDMDRFGVVAVIYANSMMNPWLHGDCRLPVVEGNAHCDIYNLGYRGINYLIERGFTQIRAVLPKPRRDRPQPAMEGVRDALRDRGRETTDNTFLYTAAATEEAGYECIKDLFSNGGLQADALLSLNDNITRGLMFGLMEAGVRIPADLGIMSHANRGSKILSPVPLTRLELDPAEYAAVLLRNCKQALNQQPLDTVHFKATLIPGKSCREA